MVPSLQISQSGGENGQNRQLQWRCDPLEQNATRTQEKRLLNQAVGSNGLVFIVIDLNRNI